MCVIHAHEHLVVDVKLNCWFELFPDSAAFAELLNEYLYLSDVGYRQYFDES